MKWITRKDIKVDRVACPWLIKRFVDEKDLLEQAKQQDAIPFDGPTNWCHQVNHRGPMRTFEAIIEDHSISETAILQLALIVRAADVKSVKSA